MPDTGAVLEGRSLAKHYPLRGLAGRGRSVSALNGVSLELHAGETVALVGESGCGKSTLARLLARLESPTEGELRLKGDLLPRKAPGSLRDYSREVQLILQDPFASLNPVHRISYTLTRAVQIHHPGLSRPQQRAMAAGLLERVQLRPGDEFLDKFPHELSGGQRQRVSVARALAAEPSVLLADEPVSMLDVSIRLGLLALLKDIVTESNLALLYVTHDISTARYFADRIVVLYAGAMVESGPADDVVLDPRHPYTQMLVDAAPDPRRGVDRSGAEPRGEPPDPSDLPTGCRFHPRCPRVMPRCSEENPPPLSTSADRTAACWLYADG